MRYLLALLLVVTFATPVAKSSNTLQIDSKRLIKIDGPVGREAMTQASQILSLSVNSQEPIWLFINSPGGSVLPGSQLVQAMLTARSRGVEVKCMVHNMAASMAFVYFAACSERYAFKYSLLLWHEMRTGSGGNGVSRQDAQRIDRQIAILEKPLIELMIKSMGISRSLFFKHYYAETFWFAGELQKVAPKFLKIVDDIEFVN